MYLLSVFLVLLSLQAIPCPATQQVGTACVSAWACREFGCARPHPLTQVVLTHTQTTASTVTQVEQRFTAALLKKDDVAFGELLADDLVHISFEGQVAGKTEYMAFFKQGSWQYRKYEPSNVVVKVFGQVAVVTGRVDRTIVISSKETTGAFAFTHVWSIAGDRWRLTSSQVTTIPNPVS